MREVWTASRTLEMNERGTCVNFGNGVPNGDDLRRERVMFRTWERYESEGVPST